MHGKSRSAHLYNLHSVSIVCALRGWKKTTKRHYGRNGDLSSQHENHLQKQRLQRRCFCCLSFRFTDAWWAYRTDSRLHPQKRCGWSCDSDSRDSPCLVYEPCRTLECRWEGRTPEELTTCAGNWTRHPPRTTAGCRTGNRSRLCQRKLCQSGHDCWCGVPSHG